MYRSFLKQLGVQRRVIGALMMRELYGRFGREGLGFLWLIVEPLMFGVPVLLLWSVVRAKYEHGVQVMAIFVTGYMAILLFRHMGAAMILFIRTNANVLFHRQVSLFDIYLSRCLLEIVSNITALIVVFVIFILLGDMYFPIDLPMFFLGYGFMIWWCMAVSLLMGSLTERSKLAEKLWPVYSYTYLFFSGFFYLADWLPPKLREIALYQPSLQAYEMIRAGMFGNAVKTYGSPGYTTFVLAVLSIIGLWALRDGRRFIVFE
jgi:capsular polysaccharide transport system permease protein